MKMKKWLTLLMTLSLIFGSVSCAGAEENETIEDVFIKATASELKIEVDDNPANNDHITTQIDSNNAVTVTIEKDIQTQDQYVNGLNVDIYSREVTVNSGDVISENGNGMYIVSGKAGMSGNPNLDRENQSGKLTVNSGNVVANGWGVNAVAAGDGELQITMGNIKSSGDGIDVDVGSQEYQIGNSISVMRSTGVTNISSGEITAGGAGVSAEAESTGSSITITTEEIKAGGPGVDLSAKEQSEIDFTASGDVAGDVGLKIQKDEKATVDVVVDGTLEGKENAIIAYGDYSKDQNLNITAWQLKGSESCDLVSVINEQATPDANAAAAAALEATINYIVKVAATLTGATVIGTDEVTIGSGNNARTLQTAKQTDVVTVSNYTIAENKELAGVYYRDDESGKVEAAANEWGTNADGSFWVKMLKGGGMFLGLKLKDKTVQPEPEPVPDIVDKPWKDPEKNVSDEGQKSRQNQETITNNNAVNRQIQSNQQTVALDTKTNTVIINMRIFKSLNLLTSTLESFNSGLESVDRMVRFETEYGCFELDLISLLMKIGDARLETFKVVEYNKLDIYADNELVITLYMNNYYK